MIHQMQGERAMWLAVLYMAVADIKAYYAYLAPVKVTRGVKGIRVSPKDKFQIARSRCRANNFHTYFTSAKRLFFPVSESEFFHSRYVFDSAGVNPVAYRPMIRNLINTLEKGGQEAYPLLVKREEDFNRDIIHKGRIKYGESAYDKDLEVQSDGETEDDTEGQVGAQALRGGLSLMVRHAPVPRMREKHKERSSGNAQVGGPH